MLGQLAAHGDDDYLEDDAPPSLLGGGEDDCVEGGCSAGFTPRW